MPRQKIEWLIEMAVKCAPFKADLRAYDDHVEVICPKIPGKAEQDEICAVPPAGTRVVFKEGPKQSYIDEFRLTLAHAGKVDIEYNGRACKVTLVDGDAGIDDPVWRKASDILEEDGYYDQWEYIIGGETYTYVRGIAKDMADHARGEVTADVVTDLKILLESSGDVKDFLDRLK